MLKSILVIEDDDGIREYLKEILLENDFNVRVTGTGIAGLKTAERTQPDLVLLDLVLPDISGEEVCQKIKKLLPDTVVIILTAKDNKGDIVEGFNLGADDYMTKPFTTEELLARIKTRLKETDSSPKLTIADLELNKETMEVKRGEKLVELTPQEFKLLELLLSNKQKVLTREIILNKVWQYSPDMESRAVDVYIGYLRRKIDSKHDKKLIHSVRGFGYVIKEG